LVPIDRNNRSCRGQVRSLPISSGWTQVQVTRATIALATGHGSSPDGVAIACDDSISQVRQLSQSGQVVQLAQPTDHRPMAERDHHRIETFMAAASIGNELHRGHRLIKRDVQLGE
jgi:hypothetical protein